jgi:hypothetical protein
MRRADEVRRRELQGKVASTPTGEVGIVTSPPTGGRVTVNVTGIDESVVLVANLDVTTGDTVLVFRDAGKAWVVAKIAGRALAATGEVTTVPFAATQIIVDVAGVTYNLPFLDSYSPTVADDVAVYWPPDGSGGVVLGKLGSTPAPAPVPASVAPVVPVAPPSVSSSGLTTFPASDTSQFRGGRWGAAGDSNLYQGDYGYGDSKGAWFYGTGPTAALTGATVLSCKIRVGRKSGGSYSPQTVHLYLHDSRSRPAGDVNRTAGPTDAVFSIGETRWVDMPAAWGQTIVDTGGGVGISGSPYVVLNGLSVDPESGLLAIEWSR